MAEEETYIVRLLFEVPAKDHEAAVERVIDQLSRHGIINWVYRSQRISDGDIEHFDGDLNPVDLEDLKRSLEDRGEVGYDQPDAQGGDDE